MSRLLDFGADPPTCEHGAMDVEEGVVLDVVRCPEAECRAEGVRGPLLRWLDRLPGWRR